MALADFKDIFNFQNGILSDKSSAIYFNANSILHYITHLTQKVKKISSKRIV